MTQVSKRSVLWALFAMPALIGATPAPADPAPAPSATPAPPGETLAPPVTVIPFIEPFDLDATRRMSVKVMVGGKGPFSFLVDTGAERTVIARELAERLGLVQGEKLRMATIGGSAIVPSYRVAALQMQKLHLPAVDAPAFFGRHIGAAGLIGVDMLEQRRVLIDFRRESMQILETRRRATPLIRDDDAIVVTARNSAGRLILSDARLNGKRIDVIVDTGAQTRRVVLVGRPPSPGTAGGSQPRVRAARNEATKRANIRAPERKTLEIRTLPRVGQRSAPRGDGPSGPWKSAKRPAMLRVQRRRERRTVRPRTSDRPRARPPSPGQRPMSTRPCARCGHQNEGHAKFCLSCGAMLEIVEDGPAADPLIGKVIQGRYRPTKLLETLYITERYQAGEDLRAARQAYDHAVWNGVPVSEMDRRLAQLDQFMRDLVRERAAQWGQPH